MNGSVVTVMRKKDKNWRRNVCPMTKTIPIQILIAIAIYNTFTHSFLERCMYVC